MFLLDYVVGDKLLYTTVWKPVTKYEISVYGWNYDDFNHIADKTKPATGFNLWPVRISERPATSYQILSHLVWKSS